MTTPQLKPLGRKNYGSIAHLPHSRMGVGDHHCPQGQSDICTVRARDKWDHIIVQEKLDGSNVGVCKVDGKIHALGRAGYLAQTSKFEQHQLFAAWVRERELMFAEMLHEGERICGEWLAQAHGTRYRLMHEPFVAFDIMVGEDRMPFDQFLARVRPGLVVPWLIHRGGPLPVSEAMQMLGELGKHGALEPVEGVVYRVERERETGKRGERKLVVDFLAKWVRPDKVDGCYLEDQVRWTGQPIWNEISTERAEK